MIKRGTLVHSEKPFIHALASNLRLSRCDHCYSEYELFKCAACHYAKYCDRDCQKAAWRDHKKECSCFKKLPPGRELPNAARILARIIFKLKRGGGNEQGWYDKNKFRMFKDLMSHYSDIKSDSKRIEHAQCLFNVLRDFMGEDELPNFTEFLGIYGRMIVNSFNILDGEMSELGTGIYLGASTIDHSCEPNAVATFCGTVLNIRTVQDIHDFKWSKLRISYIETVKPRIDRNLDLWPRYYFECDCPRCDTKSEWASLEDSVICQQCESLVYVKQDNCSCSKCGWVPADDFVIKYNDIVSFTKHQHEVMRNVAYLDVCKLCLEKQSGLFHPDNVLHVRTLDLAFEASIQLQKWEDSLDFGPKLIPGFEKYYGTHHPILGLHYLKFGKILMFKDACDKALDALEKAQTILRVTHGEDHPLYRTVLSSLLLQAKTLVYNS
ncbi:SET and MYND domain-containing protein [Nesidiocoris tenuis]|uniref:SET and MYND domain-containing protein n=1 Tax=Nesidiocoris tenuis TaxID=355587 RepID=A0ABN7AM88_9HEMI|nr:SET and MYND domain-containing protein [Nesidiocoris tenuis]